MTKKGRLQISQEKFKPTSVTRNINDSISVYIFLDSETQLGKSTEFNYQGMEVQAKRAFIMWVQIKRYCEKIVITIIITRLIRIELDEYESIASKNKLIKKKS